MTVSFIGTGRRSGDSLGNSGEKEGAYANRRSKNIKIDAGHDLFYIKIRLFYLISSILYGLLLNY
jgi:hypothetical protein